MNVRRLTGHPIENQHQSYITSSHLDVVRSKVSDPPGPLRVNNRKYPPRANVFRFAAESGHGCKVYESTP
jgi:hypothetical protein